MTSVVHIRTTMSRMACGAKVSLRSAYTGTQHAATCKKCLAKFRTPEVAASTRLNAFVSKALEQGSQGSREMSEVIELKYKRKPVLYTVRIKHYWDDSLEVFVEDVSDDPRSRASVADALQRAVHMFAQNETETPQ